MGIVVPLAAGWRTGWLVGWLLGLLALTFIALLSTTYRICRRPVYYALLDYIKVLYVDVDEPILDRISVFGLDSAHSTTELLLLLFFLYCGF